MQRRAKPLERAWQRVFREAGGRVLPQCRLSELNLGLRSTDGRRVDLVARGLSLFNGVPVCGDATMVSPLHANGTPWAGAADHDGVALSRTRRKHEDDYSELVGGSRARLLVLGCEVFGRWDPEALGCLVALSRHKAREAPELLRSSAALAWHRRWLSLLSVAAQVALAETLVAPGCPHLTELGAEPPPLGDLLAEQRGLEPPPASRLGPR